MYSDNTKFRASMQQFISEVEKLSKSMERKQ